MKKPNLIYVYADQLRYFSCGYAGDKKAITPNIDTLAQNSCNLFNAVSGHPVCAPYRASLFTGKYTTSTGMVINEIRLNPNHRSFAHELTDGGYETAYIGKWHMYANELGNHLDPKNSFVPKGEHRLGFDGFFAHYGFHHEYYRDSAYYHLDTPEKIFAEGYEPDFMTDLAIDRIKVLSGQDKPFAMFLSIGTPHDPWNEQNVPKENYDKFRNTEFTLPENYNSENDPHSDGWALLFDYDRPNITDWMRSYYAMVNNLDENIGKLIKAVDDLGLAEDTIFVFTSDHGELFGAHGRRAKNIFYEEAVRVPFLIRWGKNIPYGENGVCLNTVDIMPTLLSMMGLSYSSEVEGRDLSDAIMGKKNAFAPDGALMMGTGATADWEDGHEWRGFRTERYTYAIYLVDGEKHLYDNICDPLQMNNLAKDEAFTDVLADMEYKMKTEMERVNDKFHPCSYYRKNWVNDRIILKTKAD